MLLLTIMAEDADVKKLMKRKRATAQSKFTRTFNVLSDNLIDERVTLGTLNTMYSELDKAYIEFEIKNDEYLALFDSGDEEIDAGNDLMETT